MKLYFSFLFLLLFSVTFSQTNHLQNQIRDNLELMKKDIDSAFTQLQGLENEAVRNHNKIAKLEALNNEAYYYFIKADYGKAYNLANELKKEAEKIKNARLQALAMNRIGISLSFLEINDDAEEKLLEAQQFINSRDFEDKNLIKASNYQFLSDYYFNNDQFEKAVATIKKTFPEYEKIKDPEEKTNQLARGYSNLGIRFLTVDYDSARHYVNKSFAMQKTVALKNYNVANYSALGEIALGYEKYEEAVDYLKKAEELNTKVNVNYYWKTIYNFLQQSYKGIGDQKNHEKYKMLYLELQNETNESKLKGVNSIVQEVKNESKQQIEENRKKWYIGISIAVLSLALLRLMLLKLTRRYRTRNQEAEVIQKELEEKDRQIETLEVKISDLHQEVVELAKSNDPNFYARFLDLYPEFEKNLLKINPNLSISELQFSAFLKLNFSSKDIANYTFTSVRTVQNKKYRLRSKLGIPQETDTYVFFNAL